MDESRVRLIDKVKAEWDSSKGIFRNMNPDIPSPKFSEPYLHRASTLKARIDRHQFPPGTEELDKKRSKYLLYGASFYGAPNAIILYTERFLCPKAFVDLGIMAQTIAIVSLEYQLATCLMMMPVFWPDIFRDLLEIPKSKIIALSIAIGYPDNQAVVNTFKRTREPLDTFVSWHGI